MIGYRKQSLHPQVQVPRTIVWDILYYIITQISYTARATINLKAKTVTRVKPPINTILMISVLLHSNSHSHDHIVWDILYYIITQISYTARATINLKAKTVTRVKPPINTILMISVLLHSNSHSHDHIVISSQSRSWPCDRSLRLVFP